ncbi:hypothetical protein SLS60_000006 [Paraconiothyrium brasiliense]|uniref:EF-hand domain-containing protein n=1 Tax=Paraconiothyrium brasiliense TaxID=300254 RepID=A0ABR3S515_9PLEO
MVAACHSNKKRSTPASPLFRRDGPAAAVMNNSSSDLFDKVDTSGSGNISISEYLNFVNYTTRGSLNDTRITSQWIKWFKK